MKAFDKSLDDWLIQWRSHRCSINHSELSTDAHPKFAFHIWRSVFLSFFISHKKCKLDLGIFLKQKWTHSNQYISKFIPSPFYEYFSKKIKNQCWWNLAKQRKESILKPLLFLCPVHLVKKSLRYSYYSILSATGLGNYVKNGKSLLESKVSVSAS